MTTHGNWRHATPAEYHEYLEGQQKRRQEYRCRQRQSAKRWQSANRGLFRLLAGVTVLERELALVSQGGRCAICGSDRPRETKHWCADHSSVTGKFRGVLCNRCNRSLGLLDDNPSLLRRAAEYVERGGFLT